MLQIKQCKEKYPEFEEKTINEMNQIRKCLFTLQN